MNVALISLALFGSLIVLLAMGLPLVFAMGGMAAVGIYLVVGPQGIPIVYFNVIAPLKDITYVSIPLFVYMAYMLEKAGIAENLYTTILYWAGGIKGSLAMGTVVISTILAAMVGLSSASIVTMGVTVLPAMLKRGYDRNLAMGAITAGSTLGILIPPSALGALYASAAGVSVGRMFLAGFFPGFLISGIFIIYIGVRCYLNPKLGPAMTADERVSQSKKMVSLTSVIIPSPGAGGIGLYLHRNSHRHRVRGHRCLWIDHRRDDQPPLHLADLQRSELQNHAADPDDHVDDGCRLGFSLPLCSQPRG
jgi:TRAP-type mannitol/chloroaromatic compound transport system permease large subunit